MIKRIGVFDSGIGGVTVLNELLKYNPQLDVVYFGDTARVPYGSHSSETIIRYAKQDVRFLLSCGVDAVVIACGTVSANAMGALRESFELPIVGVIEAAAQAAFAVTQSACVAVIGTVATINSGAHRRELLRLDPRLRVVEAACPLFVPLVENGFTPLDPITLAVCRRYLDPVAESGADTVIMGCTHYPFLREAFEKLYPTLRFIDMGEALARSFSKTFALQQSPNGHGTTRFCVSDSDSTGFLALASAYLDSVTIERTETVEIDKY